MPDEDALIEGLNRAQGDSPGIRFCPATDPVVEGADLEETGNRQYGQNVYVATGPRYEPREAERRLGRTIRAGTTERYGQLELRCWIKGKFIAVAVFDQKGQRLTRELYCYHRGDEIDEGALAWFGPVEDICTPWSDNDPAQCQVISVDRLRAYARSRGGETKKRKKKR